MVTNEEIFEQRSEAISVAYRASVASNLDDGTVRGDRREAACMAWFPASQDPYPVSVKFKGDDGEIICVREINIISSEDILYNGVASKQYRCDSVIGGLTQKFALIFYPKNCRWEIVLNPKK